VETKASSSLMFHCRSNGVVNSPTCTEIKATNQTKKGLVCCVASLVRTSNIEMYKTGMGKRDH
jgi:hypothetical protein